MKITYRRHPLIEQLIEISKLSLHLQERIYHFLNGDKTISEIESEGNDLIDLIDMRELEGTVKATIDEKGNINCFECKNCTDCTRCTNCTNCKECVNCEYCINCENCSNCKDCTNCDFCDNCDDCRYCTDCKDHSERKCKRIKIDNN